MADKQRFPQIPSTVWWGIRASLNKTPNAKFDERTLSIELNVQPAAAKQYITELIAVGILNDENRATQLANKWRMDSSYEEAVKELLSNSYPQGLLDLAPPSEGNRAKATTWFQQEGLGQGAAGNKAATYFLLGTPNPNEAPSRSAGQRKTSGEATNRAANKPNVKPKVAAKNGGRKHQERTDSDIIPLNVNVQIHISADAGSDQIESIFAAMRRYLNEKQDS